MKNVSLLLAICAIGCLPIGATETSIPLKDVLLFQNGAELHHQTSVPVVQGENTIILQGISSAADFSTLQITLSTGNSLAGHEYTTRKTEDKELSEQRAQLRQDSAQLSNECETLQKSLTILEKGMEQSIVYAANNRLTQDGISNTLTCYQKNASTLRQQLYTKESALSDCKRKMNALQEKEREQGNMNALTTGVLTLHINAKQTGTTQIDLRYFTYSGSWDIEYDAHISAIGDPIMLTQKAVIQQQTGFDWENVDIRLSSASPSKGMIAPEPSPYILKRYQARAKAMPMAYAKGAVSNSLILGTSMMEDAIEEVLPLVGKEYAIGTRYSIKGNGQKQSIPLEEIRIDSVHYECYTLPQQDQRVYLTAHLKDVNKYALLPGSISVIYHNTYYGEQYLATDMAKDDIVLTLGEEPMIQVKREQIEEYTTQKQTQRDIQRTFAYKITVQNNAKEERTIVLEEAYPISSNNQISVALSDKTTPTNDCDTSKGILTYRITLLPQQSETITVGYTVKYPKDWSINL